LITFVWFVFSCPAAIVPTVSAAGLDDFTTDARLAVTSVSI
jgi:hypothetical protein